MIVKLKDVCTKIGSGATPSGGKGAYVASGISLIRSQNVLDFSFSYDGLAHITESQAKKLDGVTVCEGDVLLNITGDSVARACKVNPGSLPARVNQHVAIIRADENKILSSYILYYLQSIKPELLQLASNGATRNALTKQMIENLSFDLPSVEIQSRIVSVLDSIQEKIEKNEQINGNLLEQVQALYRYIFVESDHVLKQCRADEYFNITIGKTPPRKEPEWFSENRTDIKWFSISDMGKCGTFISDSSEYLKKEAVERFNVAVVPENTVLLSFKLTVGRIAITTCVSTTNEAIAHFKTNDASINPYLYCYLKDFKFDELGSTSSIATAVNSKIIKGMPFAIPERDELTKFNEFAIPAFAQIKANQSEIQRLSEMRDTLLPKLMSGELDVSEL